MVELLLAKGAYVDPEAHCGTPLHVAAMKDHDGAMKILLNHNADVSLSTYYANVICLTDPLLYMVVFIFGAYFVLIVLLQYALEIYCKLYSGCCFGVFPSVFELIKTLCPGMTSLARKI
jgi:ankyrin repeat protein